MFSFLVYLSGYVISLLSFVLVIKSYPTWWGVVGAVLISFFVNLIAQFSIYYALKPKEEENG